MTTNSESLPARRKGREEVLPALPEFEAVENPNIMVEMLELARDNLRGATFDVAKSLQKIRADKGGFFTVETAEGPQTERSFNAIILANRQARLYWGRAYNPGQTKDPPACTSQDGFVGIGKPGGNCLRCPYSKFRSARNPDGSEGAGQACKELRQLLVLLPDQRLPHLLSIGPTSLKTFDKYTQTVASSGSNYWTIITKFSLEMVQSSGYPVAKVLFALSKRLTPEQKQMLRPYHEQMRELLAPMIVDASAYEMTDEPDAEGMRSKPRSYHPEQQEPEPEPAGESQPENNPDDIPF